MKHNQAQVNAEQPVLPDSASAAQVNMPLNLLRLSDSSQLQTLLIEEIHRLTVQVEHLQSQITGLQANASLLHERPVQINMLQNII